MAKLKQELVDLIGRDIWSRIIYCQDEKKKRSSIAVHNGIVFEIQRECEMAREQVIEQIEEEEEAK